MTRASTVPPDSGSGLVGTAASSRLGRAATQSGIAAVTSAAEEEGRSNAWSSLASWLRNGRLDRGLSIADIARTTKIQARILEDLEAGATEGLPADVFVRGFVRNYARCVGLSEAEALARYSACSRDAGPVATPAAAAVAEMYAPTSRRISTVVPVAPGSPAAEVHAQSHVPSSGYARPGYARAATSPGSGLSSSPRILRAPTENGEDLSALAQQGREVRRPSAQLAAAVPTPQPQSVVTPAVIYPRPAVGSGVVSTAGVATAVATAVEAEVSRQLVAPVAPVAVAPVAVAPVAVTAVAPEAVTTVGAWPSSNAKKRKAQKRKEREERQARRNPRAQTVRPMLESDLYEIEPAIAAAAAATAQMEAVQAAASQVVAAVVPAAAEAPVQGSIRGSVEVAPAAAVAVEGWPSVGAGAGKDQLAVAAVAADEATPIAETIAEPVVAPAAAAVAVAPASEVWIPRMPPAPRPSRSFVAPTLTIDDSDPESASQLQDDRDRDRDGREPTRRTFLPPILLESQDRANRQGGLTLAVIILLIAATLTLSYLMRRPSTGGAGMTRLEMPIEAPVDVDAPSPGGVEHLG
jgi:Helix-turn-helix domain